MTTPMEWTEIFRMITAHDGYTFNVDTVFLQQNTSRKKFNNAITCFDYLFDNHREVEKITTLPRVKVCTIQVRRDY